MLMVLWACFENGELTINNRNICILNLKLLSTNMALSNDNLFSISLKNREIIYIRWTINFVYSVGGAIHELKIPTKYLFAIIILQII